MKKHLLPLLLLLSFSTSKGAATAASEPRPQRRPVLLVHGIGDTGRTMRRLANYLRSQGWEPHVLSLTPNWGQAGLEVLAGQVAAYADTHFAKGEHFDLVGFSMGGLVARYYVQRLGGLDRVGRFVTVSSPHNGTALAYLLDNPGSRQMRPHSPFLADLERDSAELARVRFISLWTPLDLIILPARSSCVAGAPSERIWCLAHPLMICQPSALRSVAEALSEGETPHRGA